MEQIYDVLRNTWIVALPEEIVRQKWIEVMLNHLSFPKELIVIEKHLSLLPGLNLQGPLPDRRIDLLAYYQKDGTLWPLFLMECKCTPLNQKALLQVQGYNQFIKAPYVAIANEEEILIGFEKEPGELETINFLPAYPLLMSALG